MQPSQTKQTEGKILVVECEPLICRLIGRILRRHGAVVCCNSASDARRMLEQQKFDMVIAGGRTSREEGPSLLEHVSNVYPGTGRVLLTGARANDDAKFANTVLLKPFRVRQLVAVAGLFITLACDRSASLRVCSGE